MVAPNLKAETLSLMDQRASLESQMNAIINPQLRNDYKDITNKIAQSLQILHSGKLTQNASMAARNQRVVSSSPQQSAIPVNADLVGKVPFAFVDEIPEACPAAEDGFQLGDQIVKFGSVEIGDQLPSRLASEVQSNQGKPVPVVIIRQGSLTNLLVTPRQWHGHGLLGCHFQIL